METQEVLLSFPNHSFRMFQESLAPDTAMCSAPGAPATRAASTTLVNDAAFHHLQITFSECNLRLLVSCTVKLWTFSAICCCQVAMNFFRVSRFCCTLGEWHASQRIWQTLNCIHGLIRVFPISFIQRAISRKTNLEATLLLMISHLSINKWLICLKNATAREIPNHSSENQGDILRCANNFCQQLLSTQQHEGMDTFFPWQGTQSQIWSHQNLNCCNFFQSKLESKWINSRFPFCIHYGIVLPYDQPGR